MAAAAEEGVPPEIEPPANTWGADLINAAAADTAAPAMQILVSDPRVGGESRNKMGRKKSTIVFKVAVETDLTKYQGAKDGGEVYRRYSQFRWLHQRLGEKYPGVPRPSLPPKVKVGGLDPRRASLEKFMNSLVLQPDFLLSTELLIFLTASEEGLALAMELPELPYLQKGWDEFRKNNAQKASVWFGQALQEYIVRKDITGQFQSLRFLGEVCQHQERWTAAAKTYRQLLKVAQQMDDHEGSAIALINLAKCCHQLKDYQTAVSCLTDMFERAGQMKQVHLQAVALRNIGMVHASLYDYTKAITNFREELQLRQELDDKEESMKASEAVGLMLFRMFDVQGAIDTFSAYLNMADECEAMVYKGLALLGLGTFYDYLGQNETSISYLRQSLTVFENLGDQQNATVVLNNIGIYYRRVCQFGTADKHFRQAYNIAKDNKDEEMQTRCLRNMAIVANQMDDFDRSISLVAECVRLAEKVNDRRLLAQAYRTQAEIFTLLNNMEDAHKLYTICDGICCGTEDKVEHSRCLCGLAELAAGKSPPDNAKALHLFEKSMQISGSIDYKKGQALASYGSGLVYRRLGDFSRAADALQDSVNNFQQIQNDKMHCRALAQLALCKCYAGIYEEALSMLQQAKDIAVPVGDKKGVDLVTENEDAVQQLELLLVRNQPIVLKAQRRLPSSTLVGVLITITPTEIRLEGDGKKVAEKHRPEDVDETLPIHAGLIIDLDRTPKRLLFLRGEEQELQIACQQRSLLYTVLTVLSMRMRACCGQSSAAGACLSSMQVGVKTEFVISAKVASGEPRVVGGDNFSATLTRQFPLPGEPVYTASEDVADGGGGFATVDDVGAQRVEYHNLAAYDISDAPAIVVRDDDEVQPSGAAPTILKASSLSRSAKRSTSAQATQELEIIDNQDGTYTCIIDPTFSGQCSLQILLNGVPIQGAPFTTVVSPAELFEEKCEIPDFEYAVLGGVTQRMLHAQDRFGNQLLTGGATVKVVYRSAGRQSVLDVVDNGNGTYSFSFDAGASGSGQLLAWVNDVAIESSPMAVSVAATAPSSQPSGGPQQSGRVSGGNLMVTLPQCVAAVSTVASNPGTFAESQFTQTTGWTALECEQCATALTGELQAVTDLVQTHDTHHIGDIVSALQAAIQAGANAGEIELPAGLANRLAMAKQAYDAARNAVGGAVGSGSWDAVAQRVEARAQARQGYIAVLREAASLDDGIAGPALQGPLADLLASVPPNYGASSPQFAGATALTEAAEAAAAFALWEKAANNACASAMHEFNHLCSQVLSSTASINTLWLSLVSSGRQSVQSLMTALAPMASALESAKQQAATTGFSEPAEDDEDGDDAEPSVTVPASVTTEVTFRLPDAMAQCEVVQGWGRAVGEVTDAQSQHGALCRAWADAAQLLSRQLRMLSETSGDVGPVVVAAARRFSAVAVPSQSSWARDQKAMLEAMVQLAALEEQVPHLELDFHTLSALDKAVQQREGPALVQRLQDAVGKGFVELQSNLDKSIQMVA